MSHVKNYDVGQIRLDLLDTPQGQEAPYMQYTHELPLLSFGDIQHNVNLSLVFNYERYRNEKSTGENPFFIAPGFKLNLQKRLLYTQFGVFDEYQEENGKIVKLNPFYGNYTFSDDSQRIIRQKVQPGQTDNISGGNIEMGGDDPVYDYFLEYPDFSKEKYTESGKLAAVYDKYSDTAVLEYSYDANGRLSSIAFRNGKAITLGYDTSNRLETITYNNQISTLHYTNSTLDYVEHYTGVRYDYALTRAISSLPESDFKVTATASENGETVSYAKALRLTGNGSTIEIIDYIGSNTVVNKQTYKPSRSLLVNSTPIWYVDMTDYNGITTRIQVHNKKITCSYELQNGEPLFNGNDELSRCVGNISLYGTNDGTDGYSTAGVQTRFSGLQLGHIARNTWETDVSAQNYDQGYYILTGWVKSNADDTASTTINMLSFPDNSFSVDLEPNGQWKFFSTAFCITPRLLNVCANGGDKVSTRDFRITFHKTEELTNGDRSHMNTTEYVLLDGDNEIPFEGAQFFYRLGNRYTPMPTTGSAGEKTPLTISDVMRYKMRKKRTGRSDEIYYNNTKKILAGADDLAVLHDDAYISVSDLDLGIKTLMGEKESLTRLHELTAQELANEEIDNPWMTKTCTVGDTVVSIEKLDMHLDVLQSTSDGITTVYVRDAQGRITEESVEGIYKKKTTYTAATVTTEEVNPTTGATISSVKYYLYSAWGVVYKVEVRDATGVRKLLTKDTFDDSKCTLLKKEFGNGLGRANHFDYAKGMLSSVYDDTLHYNFSYNNTGDLESITKNDTSIECHEHSRANGVTTVESKYPSASGTLHTEKKVFDKYGRLASIEGVLENTYCLDPYWYYFISQDEHCKTMEQYDRATHGALSQVCAEINGEAVDCKDAALSQAMDKLTNECTQYGYDNGLLTAAVTRSASSTLLRQETYVYDALGRLKKNHFDYDIANGHHVTSSIIYRYPTGDPFANNQVDEYTYKVNGATKALTHSDYDNFNRLECKRYNISGKWFERTFTYDKTQISQETHGSSVTNYQYDDLGRITCINSNNTPISYVYDTYGQLTRENNKVLDKTFVYEYNNNGGITKVKEYAYTEGTLSGTPATTSFTYDGTYPDRLTACGGVGISYNAMGCPTTVNGYTATWTRGKLAKLSKGNRIAGTSTYQYGYNALGQRISSSYTFMHGTGSSSAIAMGTLTNYNKTFRYDQSGRLIAESIVSKYYGEGDKLEKNVYLYDETGIVGMVYTSNNTTNSYYFRRNLLGDVIGIYDTKGKKVAG